MSTPANERIRALTNAEKAIAQRRFQAVVESSILWDETVKLITGGAPGHGVDPHTWSVIRRADAPTTPTGEPTDG